jgi:excinuclease ABC subunit B
MGQYDCVVGVNLLREGLDLPEVSLVAILDADKEGFLRDARSLIQIIGRAARNVNSQVILYGDMMTDSMTKAIAETKRRRDMQTAYNRDHNIVPQTIKKPVKEKEVDIRDTKHVPKSEIPNVVIGLEKQMRDAAENLDFERAIALRDQIKKLTLRFHGGVPNKR